MIKAIDVELQLLLFCFLKFYESKQQEEEEEKEEQQPEIITINPAMKRHYELEIKRRFKMHQEMQIS